MNKEVFKIDTLKFRVVGNYIDSINRESLKGLYFTDSYLSGKLKNLNITAKQYGLTIEGSVSNFMQIPINHSNIEVFLNALIDTLNVSDIEFAKFKRIDICTDIDTSNSIGIISDSLGSLKGFKRPPLIGKTLYYNTSQNSNKGTTLKLYQKRSNTIRLEFAAKTGSKYLIPSFATLNKHFLNLCEVSVDKFDSIKKLNRVDMKEITKFSEIEKNALRYIYNRDGMKGLQSILDTVNSKSYGYLIKQRILQPLQEGEGSISNELLKKFRDNLDNTINLK